MKASSASGLWANRMVVMGKSFIGKNHGRFAFVSSRLKGLFATRFLGPLTLQVLTKWAVSRCAWPSGPRDGSPPSVDGHGPRQSRATGSVTGSAGGGMDAAVEIVG